MMRPDEWEYDPEYIAAYQDTVSGRMEALGRAITDTGNEIAHALLPHLLTMSSGLRAWYAEWHADTFDSWPWYRRWWHTITGHRR